MAASYSITTRKPAWSGPEAHDQPFAAAAPNVKKLTVCGGRPMDTGPALRDCLNLAHHPRSRHGQKSLCGNRIFLRNRRGNCKAVREKRLERRHQLFARRDAGTGSRARMPDLGRRGPDHQGRHFKRRRLPPHGSRSRISLGPNRRAGQQRGRHEVRRAEGSGRPQCRRFPHHLRCKRHWRVSDDSCVRAAT